MNIALINGSPRGKGSNSGALLGDLKGVLPAEVSIREFHFSKPMITDQDMKDLQNCSTWIFAFPLYVDAIPSHLLSCLGQLEQADFKRENIHIYAIVNCGFYEAKQNRHAVSMMEIWCEKAGLTWEMGIGFGAGGGLSQMKNIPLGKGPKKNLGIALAELKETILAKDSKDNLYMSMNYPRFVHKLFAEAGWRKGIKANGGKVKDLKRQL